MLKSHWDLFILNKFSKVEEFCAYKRSYRSVTVLHRDVCFYLRVLVILEDFLLFQCKDC